MSRVIDDELEPVVRTLLGVIDVDGGATREQLLVLRARGLHRARNLPDGQELADVEVENGHRRHPERA